jgi:hypothetical protein
MSRFCGQCGERLDESDRFCRQCGKAALEPTQATEKAQATGTVGKSSLPPAVAIGACLAVAVAATAIVTWRFGAPAPDAAAASAQGASSLPVGPQLSGSWEGSYSYAGSNDPPVPFTFAASVEGEKLTGTVMEPHSLEGAGAPERSAKAEGKIEGSKVHFSKAYGADLIIDYDGTIDTRAKRIAGLWKIRGSPEHGKFSMTHRTPELRIVQVSAPPTPAAAPPPEPADENTQLAAQIRSQLMNRKRIIFDTSSAGCDENGRPPPGRLVCGSIDMRTVPCSAILDVERVSVTDIGRDPVFGVVPVEAVAWIRITDMEKFRGQQRSHVIKCVDAPDANWSTETAVPIRFRFDAQRWQSGWKIVGR